MGKIQFQRNYRILFQSRPWGLHCWNFPASVLLCSWDVSNEKFWLRKQIIMVLIKESAYVWSFNWGEKTFNKWTCKRWKLVGLKIVFHNHLGFRSEIEEACWGGYEVQRFRTVFWSWKNWQFDCDFQVMMWTALFADIRGVCLKKKSELEKILFIQNQGFLEVFSSWDFKEAEMNIFWFKRFYSGIKKTFHV